MKLKTIITLVLLAHRTAAVAQIPPNIKPMPVTQQDTLSQVITTRVADIEISRDPENERVVYKGLFSWQDMENEPTFSWLPSGMEAYNPDPAAVAWLQQNLHHYRLLIFIGTWCSDTKDLLPKLFKVLQQANIATGNLMMVGMDRKKTTITREGKRLVKKYKAKTLPAFVVIDENGDEVGRIEESANKSVEEDLVNIISKK